MSIAIKKFTTAQRANMRKVKKVSKKYQLVQNNLNKEVKLTAEHDPKYVIHYTAYCWEMMI
jgi:hypothetical protein